MFRLPFSSARPALALAAVLLLFFPSGNARAVTREEVERAIRDGVRYLKQEQQGEGSWEDANKQALTGTTSLVTLALLTAGERPDSPAVRKALDFLRRFSPEQLRSTYAIALQTMVFSAADPEGDQLKIANNVGWLERA